MARPAGDLRDDRRSEPKWTTTCRRHPAQLFLGAWPVSAGRSKSTLASQRLQPLAVFARSDSGATTDGMERGKPSRPAPAVRQCGNDDAERAGRAIDF